MGSDHLRAVTIAPCLALQSLYFATVSTDQSITALPCPDSNFWRSGQGSRRFARIVGDKWVDCWHPIVIKTKLLIHRAINDLLHFTCNCFNFDSLFWFCFFIICAHLIYCILFFSQSFYMLFLNYLNLCCALLATCNTKLFLINGLCMPVVQYR